MINTLRPAAALWASLATFLFADVTPVFSQAPSDAQRSAIRSECRSDYEAHCASVPPGGAASLQCLQKNMSSLSPGCQTAVRAVEPPAAPKAETAPAAAPKTESAPSAATTKPAETAAPAAAPKATASTPAKKPSDAQIAAIRSACRSDYQKVCAGVPTGGAAALQCLEKNKSKVSGGCQQAVNAASGGAESPAAGGAPAAAATASPVSCNVWSRRPLRFRPPARTFWPSSRRDKESRSFCRRPAKTAATRRERRGSTGSTGPTRQCSRATSRPDTRHASPAWQVYKARRGNSGQEG